jgi:hypothetical protein
LKLYNSDPEVSDQFGEYALWWGDGPVIDIDPPLLPCGRLHGGPSYFQLDVSWTSSPLVLPVDTNQLLLFENQFLKREYAQQLQPTAKVLDWISSTLPQIAVYNSHFRSSKFSIPLSVYDKITWYLVYGTGSILQAFQYLELPDYNNVSYPLFDQDSYGQPAGNSIDEPNQFVGWTLLLVRQIFSLTESPAPLSFPLGILDLAPGGLPPSGGGPYVSYHTYGAWSLTPDNSVFDPTVPTIWQSYHNPLGFPPHQITLTPWQP